MAKDVVEDAELRDELLRRAEVDQQARRACSPLFAKARYGTVHPDDPTPDEQAIVDRLTEVDRDNTRWLGELVERQGWPTRSLVGAKAAGSAWLTLVDGEYQPRDLRDPETVDERRAAAGMGTLAEYQEGMHGTS